MKNDARTRELDAGDEDAEAAAWIKAIVSDAIAAAEPGQVLVDHGGRVWGRRPRAGFWSQFGSGEPKEVIEELRRRPGYENAPTVMAPE